MTAFTAANVDDQAHIVNNQTKKLVEAKNNRYFQTKEEPHVVIKTVKRLNKLTPDLKSGKRTAYIVVGQKGKKRNVQIFSTKDLHSAFTAESRLNIIRAASKDLRSSNNATFNKGLRFVFRACCTRIDQQYQYALDKYDLSNQELDQVNHPRRIALPIALALGVIVMALIYFLKKFRRK